jgi:hypothetical protein
MRKPSLLCAERRTEKAEAIGLYRFVARVTVALKESP